MIRSDGALRSSREMFLQKSPGMSFGEMWKVPLEGVFFKNSHDLCHMVLTISFGFELFQAVGVLV